MNRYLINTIFILTYWIGGELLAFSIPVNDLKYLIYPSIEFGTYAYAFAETDNKKNLLGIVQDRDIMDAFVDKVCRAKPKLINTNVSNDTLRTIQFRIMDSCIKKNKNKITIKSFSSLFDEDKQKYAEQLYKWIKTLKY